LLLRWWRLLVWRIRWRVIRSIRRRALLIVTSRLPVRLTGRHGSMIVRGVGSAQVDSMGEFYGSQISQLGCQDNREMSAPWRRDDGVSP
jgi:hypothetical protein